MAWPLPVGLGRRIRKAAIAPATTQAMMISKRGLQKAGRFSGGGVGEDAIYCWMQDGEFVKFLWRGERVFFRGFLAKTWWLGVVF